MVQFAGLRSAPAHRVQELHGDAVGPEHPVWFPTPKGVSLRRPAGADFADDTFDLVITQDVFEHIFRPDLAISDIARTLKIGCFRLHRPDRPNDASIGSAGLIC
ncbi:methyltransferase domain-containing protein [Bradyrhizobium sp. CCBAU 051011]|uniref:methyltransferase domain-containing protein n=1 Tax=Bradyrhizobium sp. CCBAU 051011 TaxID=858422 RepID=UPI00352AE60F